MCHRNLHIRLPPNSSRCLHRRIIWPKTPFLKMARPAKAKSRQNVLRNATKSIPKKALQKKAAPTVRRTRATSSTTARKRIALALARRIAALAASPTRVRIKFALALVLARAHRIVALVAPPRRVAPQNALHRRVVTGARKKSAPVAQGLLLARVAQDRAQGTVARGVRRRPISRSTSLRKSDAWSKRCGSSGSISSVRISASIA